MKTARSVTRALFFAVLLAVFGGAGAQSACEIAGQTVASGEQATVDCVMLNGTAIQERPGDGTLECVGGQIVGPGYRSRNEVLGYICQSAAAYNLRPSGGHWFGVASFNAPSLDKPGGYCRGDPITLDYANFNARCIDGGFQGGVAGIMVRADTGSGEAVVGNNCGATLSSQACASSFRWWGTRSTRVVVDSSAFPPDLDRVVLRSYAGTLMETGGLSEHYPMVHFADTEVRFLDPASRVSTDRYSYERGEPLAVSGSATCCGGPGTRVSLSLVNGEGETVWQDAAFLDASGAFSASFSLPQNDPALVFGVYTLRAVFEGESASACTAETTLKLNYNKPPTGKMTVRPTRGVSPLTSRLRVEQENDEDGYIVKREWLLPGGKVVTGRDAEAVFDAPGTHRVVLVLTDNLGGQAVYFQDVTVEASYAVAGVKASGTRVGRRNTVGVSCDYAGDAEVAFFEAQTGRQVDEHGAPSNAVYTVPCNTAKSFGPWEKEGLYRVTAKTSLACSKCSASDHFTVSPPSGAVSVPDNGLGGAAVVLAALALLLSRRRQGKPARASDTGPC